MKKLALAFASFLFLVVPVKADEPPAFAAAISPEQAFEMCRAADVGAAAACALKKCKDAGGDECVVITACDSGWAGLLGISTGEIHFTDAICGAPSEPALMTSLSAYCKGHLPYAKECYLSSIWSPDGKEKQLEKTLDPRKIK
ncbi:MAG: hypothetical protein LCH46_06380 [Proteobacteria bacterium]|nr:hypothetical protein [Pseudomonadota bacterium]